MTNTIKLPLACFALAATLPVAAPAVAQDGVLIVSQSAMTQWQEARTKELDRLLLDDRGQFGRPLAGIVQISFTLDENGRPAEIETVHNSAGIAAHRLARWAVSKMRDLDDVPAAEGGDVRFQANMIFADNERDREGLAVQLATLEQVRLANAGPGTTVIAIG